MHDLVLAAYSTTITAIFGGIVALPYLLYRLVRKPKPVSQGSK
jgi:hypothetical protein